MASSIQPPKQITAHLSLLYESNMVMTVIAMVAMVFINNVYHASKMALENRKPIFLLCFIQALLGAIANISMIVLFFWFNSMCGLRVYTTATMNLFSTICIEMILLIKAYYCSESSYAVLSYGAILCLVRFSVSLVNILRTKVVITALYTCTSMVNPATTILVVIAEILLNVYLSMCFLISVYSRWKFVRTKLYAALLKDGTLYSIATSLTSIAMMTLVMLHALGDNSSVLFNISWAVASKLTVEQLAHTQSLKKSGLPLVHMINMDISYEIPKLTVLTDISQGQMERPYSLVYCGPSKSLYEETQKERVLVLEQEVPTIAVP